MLQSAGFEVNRFTHCNPLLFPLAYLARIFDRLRKANAAAGEGVPATFVNEIFKAIFSLERPVLDLFNLPFGFSFLCIAAVPS